MASNNENLKILINDAKKGEIYAFEKLYINYRNYVYKMILSFFDYNITDTEDLMQEVFILVFQQIKSLKVAETFTRWLTQITLNVCRSYVRKKGFLKNKAVLIPIDDVVDEIEVEEKFLPESIFEKKENRKIILEVIDALPSRQRLTMLLFYFNEFSLKEIAEQLDMSLSTVKVTLHKGRKKMKEELKDRLDYKVVGSGTLGIGFLMSDYGSNLWRLEETSFSSSDIIWQKISGKLRVPKLFNFALGSMVFFSFVLILFGQKSSFLEVGKYVQNQWNPSEVVADGARGDSPKGLSPVVKGESVTQVKKLSQHRATINNTAFVNEQPTNTVSIVYEEILPSIGSTDVSEDMMNNSLKVMEPLLFLGVAIIGLCFERLFKKETKPIIYINGYKRKTRRREKLRRGMMKKIKNKAFTLALMILMVFSMVSTSFPVGAMEEPYAESQTMEQKASVEEQQLQTEDTIQGSEALPNQVVEFGDKTSNEAIAISPSGLITTDGITYNVTIAKSLDGLRPADGVFADSDSIDLANVGRFDMFYAYLKIDYANNSGADLTSTSITMQMPKQGEVGYYEVYTPNGVPGNWVAYPNGPTGDGNANFPAGNMTTNGTTRLMTWTGTTITDGSTGTIYVKIPMRDPFTKFGLVDYKPKLNYTKSGVPSAIEETAQFTISGQNDLPSFSLLKVNQLGFVPTEPDADQYIYVKYAINTPFRDAYSLPKKVYEYDRFLSTAKINIDIPLDAELVSSSVGTIVNGRTLSFTATAADNATYPNNGLFVLRYPKSTYESNPTADITLTGVFNGRYVGDLAPVQNVLGTENSLVHQIGTGSVIPPSTLGNVTTLKQNIPISEDALKVGSVSFTRSGSTVTRTTDTIRGNEMVFEFNGVEYIKGGAPLPTDYGITLIYLTGLSWTGVLDPNNPMSGTITVYFDDGSSEVLKTFTEAQIIATNGSVAYSGNVPGVTGGYQPPAGKVAKRVVISFKNTPVGFRIDPYVNGYLRGYPAEGADSLRLKRTTNVYGEDIGSGRPTAVGSGDTSNDVGIVKNTLFQPQFTVDRTTTGTVNPGQTDTLRLRSTFTEKSTQSFVNPEFDVLLPAGYSFDGYVNQTSETDTNNMAVFNLPDGRLLDTSPVIEQIPNYNGTGRMLVRIKYSGILQNYERLQGLLTIRAAQYMAPGNYTIDGYFAAENIGTFNNLSNAYTPYSIDTNDMNGNGQINDYIFGTVSQSLSISRGVGASLYSQTKGSYDPALTGAGTTKQNSIADSALTLEYNGATPMNNVQLLTILPYEGDGKTLYGGVEDGQRVILSAPVDVSAYPGATVYYNTTPTDDPGDASWTTTYSTDARAVKVVLDPAYQLISGGVEKVSVPLKLQVPGTTDISQLTTVQGSGFLPIKTYSNMNPTGLEGAGSTLTSLALGIDTQIFNDQNGNGIKEADETWAGNVTVDLFNLTDDVGTATPLYSGTTDVDGRISFTDSFNGVNLNLQGYRIVIHKPNNLNFVSGVGNVTTDGNGQQGIVLNTSNQLVHTLSAFAPQMMRIGGHYWQDYEAVPNGILDAHDLLTPAGRTVKLYNVTEGKYEDETTTIGADGSYTLDNVVIGPEYRVEFEYNETTEVPSKLADNKVTKVGNNILGYSFNSGGEAEGSTYVVDAAVVENGTIDVRFSTDGTNTIGPKTTLTRSLPTTYTATIGSTEDTSGLTAGTFVVPNGYRLVPTETTNKTTTIDSTTKTNEIVFLVELLATDMSGVKESVPSSEALHPGDTITYNLTITNSGNIEATNTIVTDQVPSNTEFVSADHGGTVDANGQVRFEIPTIGPDGGSETVSFTVKVLETKDQGSWDVVNDQAKVNNVLMNSTTNSVTQSLLSSEKTSDIGVNETVKIGDVITYTIKTTNTGAAASESVTITDTVPEGTTLVEGSAGTDVTIEGNTLTLNKNSLAPGESLILTFKVKVDTGVKEGSTVDNTAKVNGLETNTITLKVGSNSDDKNNENNNGGNGGSGSLNGESKLPKTGGSMGIILAGAGLIAGCYLIYRFRRWIK